MDEIATVDDWRTGSLALILEMLRLDVRYHSI
jgi:hypothetical protein